MRVLFTLLIACVALVWTPRADALGPSRQPIVFVAPIQGMIDLGLSPFVERVLHDAAEAEAAAVVFEVNTFGGRVDAAVAIRDHLLRSRVSTVAFVNKRAISAGALITLAAEKVVMASGGTIGAATPVQFGEPGEGTKPTDEKSVSYVRKEFRATADARNRPGPLAEAMVDTDVEITGVIEKGKLLTLTTDEALKHRVAELEAEDLAQLLDELGLGSAEIRRVQENWAERVVRLLTHPVVASLLMTLGILGLVIELRTPGFGIPGVVGLLSLASFFWGHWLVELVGWEQVLLLAAGVLLLALEVFVFPGFTVAGVLGIVCLVAALGTSLFGSGASVSTVISALSRAAISTVLAMVGAFALFRFLPRLPGGRRLILGTALAEGGGSTRADSSLRGVVGISLTPLRPAGIALLDGRRVDVVSTGEFIDAEQPIEVVRDEQTRVVVQRRLPIESKGEPE